MKRKIVLAFLTAFAALSLCLVAACNNGATTGNTELGGGEEVGTEGLQYQKRKDEAGNEYLAVVGLGTALETEIVIPSAYQGLPVKEIGESAFSASADVRNRSLTAISIPADVISIGNNAFSRCIGLTEITIPDSVTSIGDSAFSECSRLTQMTIPDGMTSIGRFAFLRCIGLTEITIPDSVITIGEGAFEGCRGLISITIPENVTTIEDETFMWCIGLTNVTIENSVTSIGNNAFRFCSGLTEVEIPESVTSIGESAFEGCDNLESVTFRDPTGWSCSGTELDATALQNPTTAAVYFTKTYCDYTWTKNKSN